MISISKSDFFLLQKKKKSEFIAVLHASVATHLYLETLNLSNIFLKKLRQSNVLVMFSKLNSLLNDKFLIKFVGCERLKTTFLKFLFFLAIISLQLWLPISIAATFSFFFNITRL